MKIYIDEKNVQVVRNERLPALRPEGLFTKRKERKISVFKGAASNCLDYRICVTVCMEDTITFEN